MAGVVFCLWYNGGNCTEYCRFDGRGGGGVGLVWFVVLIVVLVWF